VKNHIHWVARPLRGQALAAWQRWLRQPEPVLSPFNQQLLQALQHRVRRQGGAGQQGHGGLVPELRH
jgi:hypothetical protein